MTSQLAAVFPKNATREIYKFRQRIRFLRIFRVSIHQGRLSGRTSMWIDMRAPIPDGRASGARIIWRDLARVEFNREVASGCHWGLVRTPSTMCAQWGHIRFHPVARDFTNASLEGEGYGVMLSIHRLSIHRLVAVERRGGGRLKSTQSP